VLGFLSWLAFGSGGNVRSAVLAGASIPVPLRSVAYRMPITVRMMPGTHVNGARLTVGKRTYINSRCFLEAVGPLAIGSNVHIANGVQLLTTTHDIGPSARRGGARRIHATSVGDGCWLGANAVVLPGVTIGRGCVIAAGAVVSDDCAPDGLYAGVPAVRKRDLPTQ